MNCEKKDKISEMLKTIQKYGKITQEYKMRPDPTFPPYQKGSYNATFQDKYGIVSAAVGNINKYMVYKDIINLIKNEVIPCIKKG